MLNLLRAVEESALSGQSSKVVGKHQILMSDGTQTVQNATVRLAVEMGLPHVLVEAKEMSADELAVKCDADKLLVGKILDVFHLVGAV